MARILLGWELGANQGHISRLMHLVAALADEGHELALALQNLGDLPAGRLTSFAVYQAPIWPRLLVNMASRQAKATASMGDILYNLGLDRAETLPALIAGWHNIFAAFQPDLVIADFAPALLTAARGRVRSISIGTGFSMPPSGEPDFPTLLDGTRSVDTAPMLQNTNAGLIAGGYATLPTLPGLFAADIEMVSSFPEIDPYANYRSQGYCVPSTAMPLPQINTDGGGDEVFIYSSELAMAMQPLWDGLRSSGLKIRAYIPRLKPDVVTMLQSIGVIVEPEKQSFADIARRSRIVMSHGGHGFVCSTLLAGLPHVIAQYDLEKLCHGRAIAALGLGGHVELRSIKAEAFATSLRQLYYSDAAQDAARAAAVGFQAQIAGRSAEAEMVAAVAGLL